MSKQLNVINFSMVQLNDYQPVTPSSIQYLPSYVVLHIMYIEVFFLCVTQFIHEFFLFLLWICPSQCVVTLGIRSLNSAKIFLIIKTSLLTLEVANVKSFVWVYPILFLNTFVCTKQNLSYILNIRIWNCFNNIILQTFQCLLD